MKTSYQNVLMVDGVYFFFLLNSIGCELFSPAVRNILCKCVEQIYVTHDISALNLIRLSFSLSFHSRFMFKDY